MRVEGKMVSIAQLCRWFGVARSTFYYRPGPGAPAGLAAALVAVVRQIIETNPTYGLRRITALVRRTRHAAVNRKRIHRIIRTNGWQVRQRPGGQRPRVQGWTSRVETPNTR
jgi:putative transposase